MCLFLCNGNHVEEEEQNRSKVILISHDFINAKGWSLSSCTKQQASPLDYKLRVSWTLSGRLKEEILCVDVIVNGVSHFCI